MQTLAHLAQSGWIGEGAKDCEEELNQDGIRLVWGQGSHPLLDLVK